jgi:hypothetical protein
MSEIKKSKQVSAQEWSHLISSEDVGRKPLRISLSVPKDSIPALCKRLGISSIEVLKVDFVLTRNPVTKVIQVKGDMHADIHQYCVVTAEPVAEHIEDSFEAWCTEPNNSVSFDKAKRERMSPLERSELPMLEEYDDPEEIIDGRIDLGELVTQHLSLSLNPYPRNEAAVFESQDKLLDDEEGMYNNPFAALKDWKTAEKKKD